MKNLKAIQSGLIHRTNGIREIINECVKNDGDTEETSQRICVLNALNQLDADINGLCQEDLICD